MRNRRRMFLSLKPT